VGCISTHWPRTLIVGFQVSWAKADPKVEILVILIFTKIKVPLFEVRLLVQNDKRNRLKFDKVEKEM